MTNFSEVDELVEQAERKMAEQNSDSVEIDAPFLGTDSGKVKVDRVAFNGHIWVSDPKTGENLLHVNTSFRS